MEIQQIHCGQYKSYGDFFRVWEIKTDKSREEVLEYLWSNVYKRRVPYITEWKLNIRYGGEKFGDAGYYALEEVSGGYIFEVCEPFAD